jgi:hypothetical protein
MRVPSVRFTVRRMMVAVAVVGLVSGGLIGLERRRQRFLHLYRRHARGEFENSLKALILL